MFLDGLWAFGDLRLLNSNSMRNSNAITREEIGFGLQSGPGRPIYVSWCTFNVFSYLNMYIYSIYIYIYTYISSSFASASGGKYFFQKRYFPKTAGMQSQKFSIRKVAPTALGPSSRVQVDNRISATMSYLTFWTK